MSDSNQDENVKKQRTETANQKNIEQGEKISVSNLVPSKEEQVMTNQQLVAEILQYLRLKDLKNTRSVNKAWDELSSKIMRQHRKIEVKLKFSKTQSTFVSTRNDDLCNRPLKNLINCVKNSWIFPCTNFHFGEGDLDHPEIQTFLSLYGQQIKGLQLPLVGQGHFGIATTTAVTRGMKIFRDIILKKCPNLEHLTIDNLAYTWTTWMEYYLFPNGPVIIPNLKTLHANYTNFDDDDYQRLEAHRRMIKEIASASPNLQEFENLTADFVDMVVDTNKMNAVKRLELTNFPYRNLQGLVKLAEAEPKIRDLCILDNSQIFTNDQALKEKSSSVVNKILKSSQTTLTRLTITPRLLSSKNFDLVIPKLDNLKELVLLGMDDWNEEICMLWGLTPVSPGPANARDFNALFPHVQSVVAHVAGLEKQPFWDSTYLSFSTVSMYSVKYLEVTWYRTQFMLKKLSFIFPNVTTLRLFMDSGSEKPEAAWSFWPALKSLRIDRCCRTEPLDPDPDQHVSTWRSKTGHWQTRIDCTHSSYKDPRMSGESESDDVSDEDSESDISA